MKQAWTLALMLFNEASARTPHLVSLSPGGVHHHLQDLYAAGGIMAVMSELAGAGLVDPDVMTATGVEIEGQSQRGQGHEPWR